MEWCEEKRFTEAAQISDYLKLSREEERQMQKIVEVYPMAVTSYYLSLVDPEDTEDPIRKMCIPTLRESDWEGEFDTSGEASNTVEVGLQHKYRETALILSTNHCAMYCRHCFRKRLVGMSDEEISKNFDAAVSYIAAHKEVSNVLITGGDSMMLSDDMIEKYLQAFTQMEHLDLIRFGTRIPVVFPDRILKDERLQEILRTYAKKKQIYTATQFNHPQGTDGKARRLLRLLTEMGIVIKNQAVLLKGVNDSPRVLGQLLKDLTASGVVPYYVFQCRPVPGSEKSVSGTTERGNPHCRRSKKYAERTGKMHPLLYVAAPGQGRGSGRASKWRDNL